MVRTVQRARVTFGLRLLVNHAERGRDAGCAVSTLPGNVRLTSDPVREAAVQVAFSETLTPALRLIRCNLKRKSGARGGFQMYKSYKSIALLIYLLQSGGDAQTPALSSCAGANLYLAVMC